MIGLTALGPYGLRRSLCFWQFDSEVVRQAVHVRRRKYSMPPDSFGRFADEAICDRIFQAVRPDV